MTDGRKEERKEGRIMYKAQHKHLPVCVCMFAPRFYTRTP